MLKENSESRAERVEGKLNPLDKQALEQVNGGYSKHLCPKCGARVGETYILWRVVYRCSRCDWVSYDYAWKN